MVVAVGILILTACSGCFVSRFGSARTGLWSAVILGIVCFLFARSNGGQRLPSSRGDVQHVLEVLASSKFTASRSIARVPKEILISAGLLSKDESLARVMADAGGRFIGGDTGDYAHLPTRRLNFVAQANDTLFLAYEKGGRALSRECILIEHTSSSATVTFWALLFRDCKTIDDVAQTLRAGEFQQLEHTRHL